MPVGAIASAPAMQLREQRRIAFGDQVGLLDLADELVGIQRHAQVIRRGVGGLLLRRSVDSATWERWRLRPA